MHFYTSIDHLIHITSVIGQTFMATVSYVVIVLHNVDKGISYYTIYHFVNCTSVILVNSACMLTNSKKHWLLTKTKDCRFIILFEINKTIIGNETDNSFTKRTFSCIATAYILWIYICKSVKLYDVCSLTIIQVLQLANTSCKACLYCVTCYLNGIAIAWKTHASSYMPSCQYGIVCMSRL